MTTTTSAQAIAGIPATNCRTDGGSRFVPSTTRERSVDGTFPATAEHTPSPSFA
jgi:hypothetical protein